ncbi:MAG: 6-carboxytetrahydropterin synthase [Phycisphaeraceae bacterium]
MIELSRTVRFCLNADGSLAADAPVSNSFAFWPPMRHLGRYYELTLTCRGEADADTGYFINIKQIDQAARDHVLPLISTAAQRAEAPLGQLMRDVLHATAAPLNGCTIAARLQLTPTYSLTLEEADMDHLLLTQSYEFAAAHRLHSPALSPEQNREVYGKCNNPAGHGHNYRAEITLRCPVDASGHVLPVEKVDAVVDEAVIQKLDHKNLDCDVPAFAEDTSSVENISRVVYELLEQPVQQLGVTLDSVRIWETSKTSCVFKRSACR